MNLFTAILFANVSTLLVFCQDVKQVAELFQGTPVDHYTVEIHPQEASAEEEDAYIDGLVQLAGAGQTETRQLIPVTMIDAMDAAEESQDKELSNLIRHVTTEQLRLERARPHYRI